MATDQDIARFLRDALPQLIAVYRFGSTASAQEHAESDLDIAVLAGDPIDAVARFELQERLAAAVGCDVDLVDLRRASTVMAMQVISTGVPLAVFDPAAQEAFEDLTYSVYARLNEERREILVQVRREGRVYGG
jgi:predicted nucleotidyltransferase